MADWEDEDFEPVEVVKIAPTNDKWDGEDEEEDIKDNWDDEEVKAPEPPTEKIPAETKVTKKKLLAKKLKEREEREAKAFEERRLAELNKTPEEKMKDKLLAQKLSEESDLEIAKDTFNLPDSDKDDVDKDTIDNFHGTTKDQFTNFEKKLSEKISEFESSPHYESFLENHFRNCCLGLNAESLKKIVSSLTVLQNEKSKQERQKKGGKKTTKAKLTGGSKGGSRDEVIDYSYDDLDDFM